MGQYRTRLRISRLGAQGDNTCVCVYACARVWCVYVRECVVWCEVLRVLCCMWCEMDVWRGLGMRKVLWLTRTDPHERTCTLHLDIPETEMTTDGCVVNEVVAGVGDPEHRRLVISAYVCT